MEKLSFFFKKPGKIFYMDNCKMQPKVKVLFSKLVRDNVIDIIESKGGTCHFQKMNKQKFTIYLKKKLLEESKEVVKTETKSDLLDELGDVYEVFSTLIDLYNISIPQLMNDYMRNQCGSLSNNVFLDSVSIENSDKENIEFFKKFGHQKESTETHTNFSVKKIVFDNFLNNVKYTYKTLDIENRRITYELKRMLVDISRFLLHSMDKKELFNNLGKIFIIFSKLLSIYNVPLYVIIDLMNNKGERKGYFKNRILLQSADFVDDQSNEYLNELKSKYKFLSIKDVTGNRELTPKESSDIMQECSEI